MNLKYLKNSEFIVNINNKLNNSNIIKNYMEVTELVKNSLKNNDIVLCTGGLGPTNDDVTLHAVTEVFKTELELLWCIKF